LGFWSIAEREPDRVAIVDPDHNQITFGELYRDANRLVHALRRVGLTTGDTVAVVVPNSIEAVALTLATVQAGMYLMPANYHLTAPEVGYLVADSDASVFIAHERFADAARGALAADGVPQDLPRFAIGEIEGFRPYAELTEGCPDTLPSERTAGALMTYTSGTTGRPKGVRRPLSGLDPHVAAEFGTFLFQVYGIPSLGAGVHLVTAPLYHTAVTNHVTAALNHGHTVVLMDKWTPEGMLERIERYRVTSTHLVPTMFHRLLRLPADVRAAADTSSLTHVVHGAAPCPIPTKRAMVDWWGPVIYEYYAASEGGGTLATPQDFEKKPGSVGKPWPISQIAVTDDEFNPLPPGEPGTVWIQMGGQTFKYHRDEEKTQRSWRDGFFTVGDAGYLDEDGYLFLCDRKSDLIISGGVNIYPAEVESVLLQHPDVADGAVFGIPDEDWGEQVKAVVEPIPGTPTDAAQADKLIAYCREQLAAYKCPKSVDFVVDFPRDPSGKVFKRRLRDPYWADRDRQI
jgi:long-chain acyl-CoA synthetase